MRERDTEVETIIIILEQQTEQGKKESLDESGSWTDTAHTPKRARLARTGWSGLYCIGNTTTTTNNNNDYCCCYRFSLFFFFFIPNNLLSMSLHLSLASS